MTQHVLRALRIVGGVALIGVGAVLALPMVPGPGLPLVFGGLTLLGQEFHWARRATDAMRHHARRPLLWLRRRARRIMGRSDDGI